MFGRNKAWVVERSNVKSLTLKISNETLEISDVDLERRKVISSELCPSIKKWGQFVNGGTQANV